jgi:hypothetical protein
MTDDALSRRRRAAQRDALALEAVAAEIASLRAQLAALNPPPPAGDTGEAVAWRFLDNGEIIESGDECPSDDCSRWEPVNRWAVGSPRSSIFKVIRRRLYARPLDAALRGRVEETGWLIELKGNTPSWAVVNPRDYDEHWTTDSTKAIRFARRQDAQAYIDHIGWTEAFPSEHIWDEPRAARAHTGGTTDE